MASEKLRRGLQKCTRQEHLRTPGVHATVLAVDNVAARRSGGKKTKQEHFALSSRLVVLNALRRAC